jgi:hypothetical protein
MGGALLQVVAVGQQDIYLTSNPEITFFKVVYRRHTNFAIESIEQTFSGTPDFGRRATCNISRNGDLIHKVYLQVDLPTLTVNSGATVTWVEQVGHALIEEVEVEIGGQKIDKHYGDWLAIWNELTQTAEKAEGYDKMIGNTTTFVPSSPGVSVPGGTLYIPLQFWFNRNPGLALPLIALQYHEVKLNILFKAAASLYTLGGTSPVIVGTPAIGNASFYADYIYLDNDERKQFAQVQHEYLIEQLQYTGSESVAATSFKSKLSFNHPCKELVWVVQRDANVTSKAYFDYSNGSGANQLVDAKLLLNGHERFTVRKADYFNLVQPYDYHTRVPSVGIYVYSFALKPEEHQPSGSLNMSRIDNATMQLTLSTNDASKLRVYAVNYNILRITSGMGGLAYSS